VPHTSTQRINLWKKHLGAVPEYVWQQTELETLILADNDLAEVSDKIGNLKRLRTLDLGHNHLTSLPDTLGSPTSQTASPISPASSS
jgi:Leucine-rich repeat (LRR) protein